MANRWSFKEDYIVCKFAYENRSRCIFSEEIHPLMLELKETGFSSRSETAISRRVREYQYLFCGDKSPNVTKQVLSTYQVFMDRFNNPSLYSGIKSFISETFKPDVGKSEETDNSETFLNSFGEQNNLTHLVHTIDYNSTFPMVLQKYVALKDIKKHNVMCRKIGMKPDTFSAILRGKYKEVKKENVLRICIGLQLKVNEAEELLNSAGFILSNSIMTDVVIKAFLWNRNFSVVAINAELVENGELMLFHNYEIEC